MFWLSFLAWGWNRQEGLRRNPIGGSTLHTFKLELGHGDQLRKYSCLVAKVVLVIFPCGTLDKTDAIPGSRAPTAFLGYQFHELRTVHLL